jgi:hypothetical protein
MGKTNHVEGSGSHGAFGINHVDDNEGLPPVVETVAPGPMSMMVKEGTVDRVNASSGEGGGRCQLHWQ